MRRVTCTKQPNAAWWLDPPADFAVSSAGVSIYIERDIIIDDY